MQDWATESQSPEAAREASDQTAIKHRTAPVLQGPWGHEGMQLRLAAAL